MLLTIRINSSQLHANPPINNIIRNNKRRIIRAINLASTTTVSCITNKPLVRESRSLRPRISNRHQRLTHHRRPLNNHRTSNGGVRIGSEFPVVSVKKHSVAVTGEYEKYVMNAGRSGNFGAQFGPLADLRIDWQRCNNVTVFRVVEANFD